MICHDVFGDAFLGDIILLFYKVILKGEDVQLFANWKNSFVFYFTKYFPLKQ